MDGVGLAGLAAVSALGRGVEAQLAGAAAFGPVDRFDVSGRRVRIAATLPDAGPLADELVGVIDAACRDAGLTEADRAATPLILAVHAFPGAPRIGWRSPAELAALLAARAGVGPAARIYTSACV